MLFREDDDGDVETRDQGKEGERRREVITAAGIPLPSLPGALRTLKASLSLSPIFITIFQLQSLLLHSSPRLSLQAHWQYTVLLMMLGASSRNLGPAFFSISLMGGQPLPHNEIEHSETQTQIFKSKRKQMDISTVRFHSQEPTTQRGCYEAASFSRSWRWDRREQVIPSKDKQMGRLLKSHRKPTNVEEEDDGTKVGRRQAI